MSKPSRVWPVVCPCPCKHYVYPPAKWLKVVKILSPGKGGSHHLFTLTNAQIAQRLRLPYAKAYQLIFSAKIHKMIKNTGWGIWTKTRNGHHCLSRWKAARWRPR